MIGTLNVQRKVPLELVVIFVPLNAPTEQPVGTRATPPPVTVAPDAGVNPLPVTFAVAPTGPCVGDSVIVGTAPTTSGNELDAVPPTESFSVNLTVYVPATVGAHVNDSVVGEPQAAGRPDQTYVYGPTPPESPAETVVDAPTGMGFGVAPGDTAGAALTVTATTLEYTTFVGGSMSETSSWKCHVPTVPKPPVETVGRDPAVPLKELPRSV
jgi:hypothetical protein